MPIFKKGSKADISNYRPISLTLQISRIMEMLLRSQILKYLYDKN